MLMPSSLILGRPEAASRSIIRKDMTSKLSGLKYVSASTIGCAMTEYASAWQSTAVHLVRPDTFFSHEPAVSRPNGKLSHHEDAEPHSGLAG